MRFRLVLFLYRGGNANEWDNAGPFYVNANLSVNANSNIGTRSIYTTVNITKTTILAERENYHMKGGLVG